nr:reverse transcriptase domain-containing protein [Tanacetum cinerariifolium]
MKKKTCKIKTIRKESAEVEVFKSSTQQSSVNEFFILNIFEVDIEPQPNSPPQELINLDPDDQPIWKSAKTIAPTPNLAIVQPSVDDNFVINSTHLKIIWKNKFDGYPRADSHDHIREFLAICDMFKYGETQSEAVMLLIYPLSLRDKIWDDQTKTDLEKAITKFFDGQRVSNMFVKNNVNDIIINMKQNEKKCQTIFKNIERKIDEWSKFQNVSLEQTDMTYPPHPQAHAEQVNAIFTESEKSDDSSKIQKDHPPPIIVNNKIEKDKPIKT